MRPEHPPQLPQVTTIPIHTAPGSPGDPKFLIRQKNLLCPGVQWMAAKVRAKSVCKMRFKLNSFYLSCLKRERAVQMANPVPNDESTLQTGGHILDPGVGGQESRHEVDLSDLLALWELLPLHLFLCITHTHPAPLGLCLWDPNRNAAPRWANHTISLIIYLINHFEPFPLGHPALPAAAKFQARFISNLVSELPCLPAFHVLSSCFPRTLELAVPDQRRAG